MDTLSALIAVYISNPSKDEIDKAVIPAMRKLKAIILRESDLNGERLEPSYLAQLVAEEINSLRFSAQKKDTPLKKRTCQTVNKLYHSNSEKARRIF